MIKVDVPFANIVGHQTYSFWEEIQVAYMIGMSMGTDDIADIITF